MREEQIVNALNSIRLCKHLTDCYIIYIGLRNRKSARKELMI